VVAANKNLKGDQLKAAVDKQAWDDSVKSLAATPAVLTMMSQKLDWTQKLGDAVLAQQTDVMDAVQRLRSRAHANKKLETTKEQKVTVRQEQNKQVIEIEPAVADTIYVPYYDPAVVYGAWPYPAYPPYYWPAPGYIAAGVLATGLAFGAGYALGRWASGGNWWGGGFNWGNNNINVNRNLNNVNIRNWQHNSAHRHGVRYNNANVRQQFGRTDAGRGARQDFRGRDGGRPGAGDRLGAGDRPGAGDRGRPGGGDRAGAGGDRGRDGARREAGRGGGKGAGSRPSSRPSGAGPRRDSAFSGARSGGAARAQAARGLQSFQGMGGGGGRFAGGGGGFRGGGGFGGGGFRGGGGGFRGGGFGGGGFRGGGGGFRGGGGRRSDLALKHDIMLLGHLDNGLGFYRFAYHGSDKAYVGVMAQDVQTVMPEAVVRGRDGYLRVFYDKIGVKLQTYEQWIASGARIPITHVHH
jgi:hypothetical protein